MNEQFDAEAINAREGALSDDEAMMRYGPCMVCFGPLRVRAGRRDGAAYMENYCPKCEAAVHDQSGD